MLKKFISVSFFLFTILLMTASNSFSQEEAFDIEELKKSAPKVFIDCDSCDVDYIRTEITFV
nr:hypothetical protein [Candidatus Aminicenantes bacterium]